MSDDKTKRGKPDRDRINVHEDYEVAYWTEGLSCTREELLAAVAAVGPMSEDVRAYLAAERTKVG